MKYECDKIVFMDSNISPALRIFVIIMLIITPLAVVILQRLDGIREIMRRRKEGTLTFNFGWLFNNPPDPPVGPGSPSQVCPNCKALNAGGQAFCGSCGTHLAAAAKGKNT